MNIVRVLVLAGLLGLAGCSGLGVRWCGEDGRCESTGVGDYQNGTPILVGVIE